MEDGLMRSGRGIIIVLIVLTALGVACTGRPQGGGDKTTGGGSTGGGTTGGGTDVSGRWEGRMDIIEIRQINVPKPPPTLYPGETTKADISCSLGGQVTVELAQTGSQASLDGHGSANGGCTRDGDIQGMGTVTGNQLTVTGLNLLGCTVSLTATFDGDSMTGSVTGIGALPSDCRIQTGELQLHRTGSA